MNYLHKLLTKLKKHPLALEEFYDVLKKSDTFFESVDLEKELLLSNGFPLYFSEEKVYLKTATTKIEDQTFCVVDIETSGGNIRTGQIIEIGAIKFRNNKIIERYESLVNTKEIPRKVQELTGITPQMTHTAPSIKTVLEEFKIFLEDDVFVAHAISFDYKFINDSFKRYNIGALNNRMLCTIDLSSKLIETQRYGLQYLKEYFNIEDEKHHRALSDAYSTSIILNECIKQLPNKVQFTEELLSFSKK